MPKDSFEVPHHAHNTERPGDQAAISNLDTVALNALPDTSHGDVPDLTQHSQNGQKSQPEKTPARGLQAIKLRAIRDSVSESTSDLALSNDDRQQPSISANQVSMVEQNTLLIEIIRTSSPAPLKQKVGAPTNQASITNQDTLLLAAIPGSSADSPEKAKAKLTEKIRHLLTVGLARLQEPQPEGLLTRGLQAVKPDTSLGLLPFLTLTNAFGLLIISLAYYLAVTGYNYPTIETYFLAGLLTVFVPNALRLLSRAPGRLERICLICMLGFALYLVQFMGNPLHFSSFDNFLHWRTAADIFRTGHLFSVNAMLPVSPYYPGLELITNAISRMTGLSIFHAGVIVTIAAHFLLVLALFLLYERVTNSSRMAGIAILIYITNQHFVFFDSTYSYETLALPFAIFLCYVLVRYSNSDKNHRWGLLAAWIALLAITMTHHMTNYVFDGLLLLWSIISFFKPVSRQNRIHLAALAGVGLLLSLAYAFFLPGNPVWSYLSDYFGSAFNQLEQIVTGSSIARPLFTSSVQTTPLWDKLFITGAVALVTFSLPFGLISLQRLYRENALAVTFGLASLAYPLTQAFRFTSFGTEITDRSAAFLFLPIAYTLTILLTHFWPTNKLNNRAISLIAGAVAVVLLGNVIVGTGPNLTALPGPYLVIGDSRSVEPEGINAALWSFTNLGPNHRIATDRTNQMLMSTYGYQRIVTRLNDEVDVAPLFYSALFDSKDIALLQAANIHFLVVDTRLSTALPLEGTYFENDVPHSIIDIKGLTKFSTVTQINRVFDSGDIVIYDTGAFTNTARS